VAERATSLREQLAVHAPELRPLAENVLTAVRRIDLVALNADGIAHTILFAEDGEDPAALTHAVAASAWLSARLSDWQQLAPDAGINAGAPARAVVVAARFHPDTLALADLLGSEHVRLLVVPAEPVSAPAPERPALEDAPTPVSPEPPPATALAAPVAQALPPEPSRFRTGLVAADLGFVTA
jgi:hypothetical protein